MFTGIIEEIGVVKRMHRVGKGYELAITCTTVLEDTRLGDSLAVNGVCLTVTNIHNGVCTVGLSPETRTRTNLARLTSGDHVNLERAVTPATRMGGHLVQGHVDATGTITQVRTDEDALWITVQVEPSLTRYIVPKGFIALDGASLTVVDVGTNWLSVVLIAYTQQHITLPHQRIGYAINVEVDVIGKYVEKMLTNRGDISHGITLDTLKDQGYS